MTARTDTVDEESPADNQIDFTSISHDAGRTDLANARRLVKAFGDDLRFCPQWQKHLIWDGCRWQSDDDGAAVRMATAMADQLWSEAANHRNKDELKFAERSSSAGGLNSTIRLAGTMCPLNVSELDQNHWLLNCLNGTVNLRTGELREHSRHDNITKLVPTKFNPDADAIHWIRFIQSVFPNPQIVDFMQRLCGYFLTGDVSEQILSVFHGSGSNGKSTLLNAVQNVVGSDYSIAAPPSLLMKKKTESHPTELAGLFGQRLVIAQETNHGARLAEGTVKQLTGGDLISARRMREDFWTFKPTHKLVLCTNHKPRVKGTDHAIWRRLVLVPFEERFWNPDAGETGLPELMQDKSLSHKLMSEREGILAWMVRGCLEWQRIGLQIPNDVRAATAEYRTENDTVGRFVNECCVVNQSVRVKFSNLYESLTAWCNDAGDSVPSRKFVADWLKDNGFRDRKSGVVWYGGIAIKTKERVGSIGSMDCI